MDTKKLKQIGFIAAVALGSMLALNSLAKRNATVAKAANAVNTGI